MSPFFDTFGSSSVADPDWIRIHGSKKDPQKKKNESGSPTLGSGQN
jgi:hypothetical protein